MPLRDINGRRTPAEGTRYGGILVLFFTLPGSGRGGQRWQEFYVISACIRPDRTASGRKQTSSDSSHGWCGNAKTPLPQDYKKTPFWRIVCSPTFF